MVQTLHPHLSTLAQRRARSKRQIVLGKWAYFEDEFVPLEEAKIGIATHALNYGTGCFGGIRAYWNEQERQLFGFRIKKHYERFLDSCKLLNIILPYSMTDLTEITL